MYSSLQFSSLCYFSTLYLLLYWLFYIYYYFKAVIPKVCSPVIQDKVFCGQKCWEIMKVIFPVVIAVYTCVLISKASCNKDICFTLKNWFLKVIWLSSLPPFLCLPIIPCHPNNKSSLLVFQRITTLC